MKPPNRPLTWVTGYTVRVLTSYPSIHITRRLLSYLNHQDTTVSHHGTSYQCTQGIPQRARNPPKSVDFVTKSAPQPHTDTGLFHTDLHIISVEQHHDTSDEPSRPSGDDGITSRSLLPVHTEHHPPGSVKPPTSARYMGNGLYRAGFDIRPID